MDVDRAVTLLGGAATRAELVRAGVPRRSTEAAVRAGRLLAAAGGAVWRPDADPALVLAVRSRSWLTCVSALDRWGVPLLDPPARPHLASSRARTERSACWHRLRTPVPTDRGPDPRARAVDPIAAVVQALRCLGRRDALVAADSALRSGLVTARQLDRAVPAHDPQGARWVVEHADERSDSVLESALRFLLLDAGITAFELQAPLPGVGRVDLLVDGWLVLEADGFAFHSGRADFLLDRQRLAVATATGHVTLRFGYAEVVHHPHRVLRCIEETRRRFRAGDFRTALSRAPAIGAGQR